VTTERHLILVVDDDEFMRDGIIAVLEAEGYAAIGARTGSQALALLRAGPGRPSLILLDFMMPSMTGAEFRAAQLQDARLADIPVVFLTAFPHTLDALQSGRLCAAAALRKPVDPRRLLALVRQVIRRSRAPREAMARFIVSCRHCRRRIAVTADVVDAEQLGQLRAHLRVCCPNAIANPWPEVEATLKHFRVEPEPEAPGAA
jgi:CheY-like chemotaxis protein